MGKLCFLGGFKGAGLGIGLFGGGGSLNIGVRAGHLGWLFG